MPTISASLCGDGEDVPAWGPRPARELCIAEDVEHVRVDNWKQSEDGVEKGETLWVQKVGARITPPAASTRAAAD